MIWWIFSWRSSWRSPTWWLAYNLLRILPVGGLFLLTFRNNNTLRNITISIAKHIDCGSLSCRCLIKAGSLELLATIVRALLIHFILNNFSLRLRINFLNYFILELFLAHICDCLPSVLIFYTLDYLVHVVLCDTFNWTLSVESDFLFIIDAIAISTSLGLFDGIHILLHFWFDTTIITFSRAFARWSGWTFGWPPGRFLNLL